MRHLASLLCLFTLILAACGDVGTPGADAPPMPPTDAPIGTPDGASASVDAPPGAPDGAVSTADGSPGAPDAAGSPDAATGCMGVGDACAGVGCPVDLICAEGASDSACIPDVPGCGGFAGTPCATGLVCVYYADADFGACMTADQRTCACDKAPTVWAADYCP